MDARLRTSGMTKKSYNMKKILVWHQGALGDLILSLPAVHAIKKHYEETPLHLICRGDMADVIVERDLAETVSSNEKGEFGSLFADCTDFPRELGTFLEGFDAAFVFMRSRHDAFFDNLRRYIPQCRHIPTLPPPGVRRHVASYQLEQLTGPGIDHDRSFPVLGAGREVACPVGPPLVVVHPGSGGKKKCWPLRKYLQVIED
ncbi:MAG: hypothetical protein P8013_14500 [Candidatus Sulfobium sp.]